MNEKVPSNRKIIILCFIAALSLIFSIVFFIYAFYQRDIYKNKYDTAIEYITNKDYEKAIGILNSMTDYKDSGYKILESKYNIAVSYYEAEEYEKAKILFNEFIDYFDSHIYLAQIETKLNEPDISKESIYQDAISLYEEKNYQEALVLFETINDYKNSNEFILSCQAIYKRNQNSHHIAGGIINSVAITKEGTIISAGKNNFKQLNTDTWENIISIDIYGTLTIGIQENGVAKITGTYNKQEIYDLVIWNDLVDIAAGEQFVVGLKSNGTVIADGHNGDGQINVDTWENVIDIDAGARFTVALTEDKQLLFTGYCNNQIKQFEEHRDEWKDVISIASSGGKRRSGWWTHRWIKI